MHKNTRSLLLAASALLAVSSATAQTANLIILEKLTAYQQTSASAPSLAGANPYRFDVSVQNLPGADLSGITAPTVTLASGSNAPSAIPVPNNGGVLVYNGEEWRYGQGGFGLSFGNVPTLNNLFASGAYSVTVQGNTYSLDLDGAANTDAFFPGFTPTVSLSGGTWSGGKYVIDVSQVLTITTNSFTPFHTTGVGGLINIELDGAGAERVFSRIAPVSLAGDIESNTGVTTATFTVAANTLTVGDHEGWASFHRMVSQDTSQAGIFAAGMWVNETSFIISAVPEPSTYAALAGVAALGLAIWQRRRKASATV